MKIIKTLVLLLFLNCSVNGLAREVIVSTTADSGVGSFRDAVDNAQPNDTIIINVSGSISLGSAIVFNTSNLTILGPYPKHNTFTGNGVYNLFYIGPSATNIQFIGLGFKDANSQRVAYLSGCSNILFKDCLFENNTASIGAIIGIQNTENVKFHNCSFILNTNASASISGGVMYVTNASIPSNPLEVINCTFQGNSTNNLGGAIHVQLNGSINIFHCLFKANSASLGSAFSSSSGGSISIYNSLFYDNSGTTQINITGTPLSVSMAGNFIKLNSGEINPLTSYPNNYNSTSMPSYYINPNITEDGYGLKYYKIIDYNSPLIDAGVNVILPINTDCRRAPRLMDITSIPNNVSSLGLDIGPCEYTPYRVINNSGSGPGSFYDALSALSSSTMSQNYIEFDIPLFNPQAVISTASYPLSISMPVYIDGYSQPGSAIAGPPTTLGGAVTPADSLIQINAVSTNKGLDVNADDVTIAGFEIYGASDIGIDCQVNTKVFGCHIGVYNNGSGFLVSENKNYGVNIDQAGVEIGGYQHWQRNVITGNGQTGGSYSNNIYIRGNADNIKLYGNFIGIQPDGLNSFSVLGGVDGIVILGNASYPQNVNIGGLRFGERNIVSGNTNNGVYIFNNIGPGIKLNNNFIGLNYYGNGILSNSKSGINISAISNQILEIGTAKGNLISGNTEEGIKINSNGQIIIENNIIGLQEDGITIAQNGNNGILIENTTDVTVGSFNKGNVISGNGQHGVSVLNANNTKILYNIIGLDEGIGSAKGNILNGINCDGIDTLNIEFNTISANGMNGVLFENYGNQIFMKGNKIGTDKNTQIDLGNIENGIFINSNNVTALIGDGNDPNIISGNNQNGIKVLSPYVTIDGNIIGLSDFNNYPPSVAVGNTQNGIYVDANAEGLKIGVNNENYISANDSNGIFIDGADSVEINNCIIGSDNDTLNFGNGLNGIYVKNVDTITIGYDLGNMIGWHGGSYAGILLEDTKNAAIMQNLIGIKPSSIGGARAIPNGYGIHVIGNSDDNSIGTTDFSKRNFFGNDSIAISFDGANVNNNYVLSNLIGFDKDNSGTTLVPAPNYIGIEVNSATDNYIGAIGNVNVKNIISSSINYGIILQNDAKDNYIYRNLIGSDTSNTFSQPNYFGIYIKDCNGGANYIGGAVNFNDGPVVCGNYVGITIDNSDSQEIKNSRIGVKKGGLTPLKNTHGIVIQNNSSGNIIGGSINTFERNIISGNDSIGVAINASSNNVIEGNVIGANILGNDSIPNLIGIFINGGSNNVIGEPNLNEGNLISGNKSAGVLIESNANGTLVQNNLIGTVLTGNAVFSGSDNFIGVAIKNTTATNTIGGDKTLLESNVFANQTVSIGVVKSSNQNIQGNYIGFAKDGSSYLGINGFGIYLDSCTQNLIGHSTDLNYGNVVAHNLFNVMLDSASNNTIANNYIGNNFTGDNVLSGGFKGVGVRIDSASTNNVIGPANVISGLAGVAGDKSGVVIEGVGTENNTVIGNYIGVDKNGLNSLSNDFGIVIKNGAKNNTIGGVNLSDKNIISSNSSSGINLLDVSTTGNQIINNFIGVDVTGNTGLPNGDGIVIASGASQNIIGGNNNTFRNIISSNSGAGIRMIGIETDSNIVIGNYIGLGFDGTTNLPNNRGFSIYNQAGLNQIGGITADSANYICSSTLEGISIGASGAGSESNQNKIIGNYIGVKPDGTAAGNGNAGIGIVNGTNNILLRNLINHNGGLAIDIANNGPTTNNNSGIQNNVEMPVIIQSFACAGTSNVKSAIVLKNLTSGNNYTIEFYNNTSNSDPSGYGEADSFISSFSHTAVNSTDTVSFDLGNLNVNDIISATLTALNGNGGTSELSKNDTVTTAPTPPQLSVLHETCQGAADGQIDITATDAYNVTDGVNSLYLGFGTVTTNFLSSLPPGSSSLTVNYFNECTEQLNGTVNAGPAPNFSFLTSDDTCGLGGTILIDTTSNTIGNLTSTPYFDYTSGTAISNSTNTFTNVSPGTYQYFIQTQTTGNAGSTVFCYSDTLSTTVTAVDLTTSGQMDFDYGVTDFCASNSISPIVLPTFSNGSFSISPMPSSFNSTNATISGATPNQEYIVVYAYGNCQTDDTITAIAPVDATFSYDGDNNQTDSLCLGETTTPQIVNPNGTFNISGLGNPTITASGQIIALPGTYNIEYITSNSGCPDTANVTVTILNLPPSPNVSTSDTILCPNESPQAIVEVSGLSVNWTVGSVNNPVEATNISFMPSVSDLNNGNNYIFAYQIDNNGCSSLPDSINLFVSTPNNLYADSMVEICLGSEVELFAYNGQSYLWSNNTGIEDSTDPSIIVSPNTNSYYHVSIYDSYGCVVNDSVYVVILDPSECHIDTYTAFSPNGDNVNDTWIIDGIEGFKENIVYIYNRWGDVIQKIENYDNQSKVWDGTSQTGGEIVTPGTYFYIVEANGTKALSGWVNVVK